MKKIKKKKIINFKILFFILILLFIGFTSCKTSEKIVNSYSIFPSSSEIDKIFATKDFDKIMSFFIFFQNIEDSSFKNNLNERLNSFLVEELNSKLNDKAEIQDIVKLLNNYYLFNYYVINKFSYNNSMNKEFYDELTKKSLEIIISKLTKIENYYLFNAYLNYLLKIFPYFEELKKLKYKKFEQKLFISNYDEVYKNTAMIISDRGTKIENNRIIPDISIGTGFFIDKDKVITNYHVVNTEGKKYILSIKIDSVTVPAKIILFDELMDLAILEVNYENKNFKYFKLADSLKIGDEVIASGNPYGLSFSNTKGIVSNLDRKFLQIGKVIQVDTPLNPGNSGGPTFKPDFELVGIAFASISNTQNLNFILPLSYFFDVLTNLFINIEVERSWLGFYFFDENLIYQSKGTINYNILNKIAGNNKLDKIKFLYPSTDNVDEKEIYYILQSYISILPRSSFVPMSYNGTILFLLAERRPKYPISFILNNDDINNVLSVIFDSKLYKEGDFYKIEKLFNSEISIFYGIYQGDMIKILSYSINQQKKFVIINFVIRQVKFGNVQKQLAISISFDQPGFF